MYTSQEVAVLRAELPKFPSIREASRELGVSRDTLTRIKRGWGGLEFSPRADAAEQRVPHKLLIPVRCRSCGARVNRLPCLACALRSA